MRDGILTEEILESTRDLDRRSVAEILEAIHREDRRAFEAVGEILPEIARAVSHHAPQVEVYRRAVQRALRLEAPPRAELWFLWPGRIVELPLGDS